MAKEKKAPQEETPRWQMLQNESIERATTLIKEHGANVEFLVIKDKRFLAETIRPIEHIDEAMDYLYRLEGRGISAEDIQKFRTEYLAMCEQIKTVETMAVEYLAKASVRTGNRNLNRKIQKLSKAAKKPPSENKESLKEAV
ncbi:MAG: hypothetical protein RBS91_08685 [Sulfurimonadaceae bacterium]|jgi:hypothetical protein|nr:hypothetical protein [Sulfurimonadaceae bacterium]